MTNANRNATPEINNPFKDVFGPDVAQRKKLIAEVKVIREKRNALRGVSGTKEEWDSLTKQMHDTQGRIDELNVKLGIEVKTFPAPKKKNHSAQPNGRPRSQKGQHKAYKGRPASTGGIRRGELNVLTSETFNDPQVGSFAKPTKPNPEKVA